MKISHIKIYGIKSYTECEIDMDQYTVFVGENNYKHIIQGFSPNEIQIMLDLPETKTVIGQRVRDCLRCKTKFARLTSLLKKDSIPIASKSSYKKWTTININK